MTPAQATELLEYIHSIDTGMLLVFIMLTLIWLTQLLKD